ncbi:hypothetical protein [Stenotrophomonas oahuensis]|uniref:Uncharacterized protein n=1 Tax=Stenotrophomonas oahuensis TaxID=3003271 RepID=A0ABY9YRB1_9GAMM|nr:hypothetical protein [Stenotrophomonas sp. A5586]WNH53456.1 hypothetical protein PDM29_04025 [Stenotrophomonas sp. A5586]
MNKSPRTREDDFAGLVGGDLGEAHGAGGLIYVGGRPGGTGEGTIGVGTGFTIGRAPTPKAARALPKNKKTQK